MACKTELTEPCVSYVHILLLVPDFVQALHM